VLTFYDSAYQAGATRAGWDIAKYDTPRGTTTKRDRRVST
jgi:hypothetical protein